MSWTAVRSFFKTKLDGLSLVEHTDAFNVENIPSTVIDRSYHVSFGPVVGNGLNHHLLESTFPVTVRFFVKGFLYPAEAVDSAVEIGENITKAVLAPSSRIVGPDIKNVTFVSMNIDALSDSNDNSAVCTMLFDCRIMLCFE